MNKNICIFEYCNFENSYLKILVPQSKDGNDIKEILINLKNHSITNDVSTSMDFLIEKIKYEMKEHGIFSLPKILLLLRCTETYHTVLTIPVKNSLQANFLYKKEIKTKINKELFETVSNSYKHGVGHLFNTYFMSKKIIDSFSKIAKYLGTEIIEVKPFGMSLCELLDYKGNYVYFYIRNKICTMILVSNKNLITSYDFEFNDSQTILNTFLLVASKYEFEYLDESIAQYAIDSDEPIELNIGINKIN